MKATDPQATAKLVSCRLSEMHSECIVKVEHGHPAHEQLNLLGNAVRNPYASLTYTMASGKVFVLTSSMGQINCYRSSVDAEPVAVPTRDPKREAEWVVLLGTRYGSNVYAFNHNADATTCSLDDALGFRRKKDAEAELNVALMHMNVFGIAEGSEYRVGRRTSFRK